MEAEEAGEVAGGIMDGAYDAAGIEELLNPVKDLIKDTISETQDLQQEAQQSLRTTQAPTPSIPLPDVSGTQMPTLSPLSEDRLALDEQLFGRPSRLG